jgi:HlyD family secretion protein
MKFIVMLTLLVVAGAATAFAVLRDGEEDIAPMYQLATVVERDIVVTASADGTVEPIRTVEVRSKASGEIFDMPVEIGDAVTAGQLMVRVDPRIPQATLRQAEADLTLARAQLENAEAQLRRAEGLYETESITEQEYDTARLSVASARAQLVRAERSLEDARIAAEDTEIRAPLNGVVIKKLVEEGTVITSATQGASGGTILLQMANLDTVQVRALVEETDIGKVEPDLEVTITVDAFQSRPFKGKVLKVEPQSTIAQNVTMFPVLVRIPNSDGLLRPGMNVEVEFHVGAKQNVMALPNAALRTDQDFASAAEVLGMDPEVVRQQIATARQGGEEGSGDSPHESLAGSDDGKLQFRGRPITLPDGVDADKARALLKKLETGDMRSMMGGGGLSSEEQALLRQLMSSFRGSGGGPGMGGRGGRGETSATDAALAGGSYIVFVLRDGIAEAVPVTTGLTDLDYSEIIAGLTSSDTLLILPSASLIASQQEWQNRMSRMTGGLPGISRN